MSSRLKSTYYSSGVTGDGRFVPKERVTKRKASRLAFSPGVLHLGALKQRHDG
jgi:hypothetical protein